MVIGIIFIFIGMSIIPSTGNIVEDVSFNTQVLDVVDNSEELLFRGETAYAFVAYDPSGQLQNGPVSFDLEDPGNITQINHADYPLFTCGTWAWDYTWFVCENINGYLWEINHFNGNATFIGGGGVSLNGLAHDGTWDGLYGCSSNSLYKINKESGAQTFIGNFSSGPNNMIDLAVDAEGVLYGWDTGTDSIWVIDKETAECYFIGQLGIDLNNQQDGHFDIERDYLYLAANTTKGQLYRCDEDTGECYLIGDFQGGAVLTAFVIPYEHISAPYAPIIYGLKCGDPGVEYTFTFIAIDSEGDDVKYQIDWGDGTFNDWFGPFPSGKEVNACYSWDSKGVYYITARAIDVHNAVSDWSDPFTIVIGNKPPDAPDIGGSHSGKVGMVYNFSFVTEDPDGDNVTYEINWGDNTSEEKGPYSSGVELVVDHSWDEPGTYIIEARVKDEFCGFYSDWTEFEITVQKTRTVYHLLLMRMFDRFPLLEKLLSLIRVI